METLGTFSYAFLIACLLSIVFPIIQDNGEQFMSKINLSSIKKAYGTDLSKELEGVFFKSSLIEGLEFKIAKSGNPAYEKMARKLYKPYTKQIRKGMDLPDSVTNEISTKLIVETLLLDWKGMPGQDGVDVVFSKAEASALMDDKELKELKQEIMEFADDNARFQIEFIEEIEGD